MLREFFLLSNWSAREEYCRVAGAWAGLLVFVGHAVFRAYLKYALSIWYRNFYDVVGGGIGFESASGEGGSGADFEEYLAERREEVFGLLVQFARIVAPAVVVHPIAKWISSVWRFAWRIALVDAYLEAYNVSEPSIEGASQRIHEDSARFEGGMYTCMTVVLDSLLTLAVFVPILLELGAKALPPGIDFGGWLVCIAAGAAVGGLGISVVVGYRLVALEVANQMAEGAFRTKLVHLETTPHMVVGRLPNLESASDLNAALDSTWESSSPPTPPPPRPRPVSPRVFFDSVILELKSNYRRLFRNFACFNAWISFFDQVLIIVPYILVAPLIFESNPDRRISLGILTQTAGAFGNVFGALAIVSEAWAEINNWRSALYRLTEFERVLYARTRRKGRRKYQDLDSTRAPPVARMNAVVELAAAEPL